MQSFIYESGKIPSINSPSGALDPSPASSSHYPQDRVIAVTVVVNESSKCVFSETQKLLNCDDPAVMEASNQDFDHNQTLPGVTFALPGRAEVQRFLLICDVPRCRRKFLKPLRCSSDSALSPQSATLKNASESLLFSSGLVRLIPAIACVQV